MIVLDAAALVDVVLAQPTAEWVLDELVSQEVYAPAHQPAEVLSALARLVRGGQIAADVAAQALSQAGDLEQRLIPPSSAHLRLALELHQRIRVLDGLYVALAQELEAPLVTTDRRLGGATAPCEVRLPPA